VATATSDTQTAIDILKAENERLPGLVSTLTSERDKAVTGLASTTTERDALKAQVGNPDEHRQRADKAEAALRTVIHKGEFARAAEAANVHRDMIDDLFNLSGYKAEKDEVDPKAFDTILSDAKANRKRFFADPAQQQQTQTDTQQSAAERTQQRDRRPIPGQDRGTTHKLAASGIRVTRAQLADPRFKLDPRNKDVIKAAASEGRVDW
jgi:hypothetical protein